MNRTTAIILTIVTVLCCACPGFGLCIFGLIAATGTPVTTTLNDVSTSQPLPIGAAIAMICVSIILIAIPIAVGFFTLRNKPAASSPVAQNYNGPIPPAS
jgi:TRAP-type C4-dicarboxylate transport system permease small subunit